MSETLESPKPKTETHKTMGGKVNIYRRENSDNWQCSTFLNGRNWRVSTHEDSLGRAKDFAEDWYLALRGKAHGQGGRQGTSHRYLSFILKLATRAWRNGRRSGLEQS